MDLMYCIYESEMQIVRHLVFIKKEMCYKCQSDTL